MMKTLEVETLEVETVVNNLLPMNYLFIWIL